MSSMIIMNYEELDNDLYALLQNLRKKENHSTDKLTEILKIIKSPEFIDPYSEYVLDPQLAQKLDVKTREHLLFGMAFEDRWCMDSVFIIMIHDNDNFWMEQY